jgi:hypothetical protein
MLSSINTLVIQNLGLNCFKHTQWASDIKIVYRLPLCTSTLSRVPLTIVTHVVGTEFNILLLNYSQMNRVKKNQLDAQLILSTSIFRQPLHVSGVFKPIIRRYNLMYTAIGIYYSF